MKLTAESTVINDEKLNTNIDNAQTSADNAQTSANNAQGTANTAVTKADNAQSTANQAKSIADNTAQYFWFTSSGTDTGAHISEKTQTQFISSPSGGNLLARSNGIAVRDGLTELATFSADGVNITRNGVSTAQFGSVTRVGTKNGARTIIAPNELSFTTSTGAEALHITGDGAKTTSVSVSIDVGMNISIGSSGNITINNATKVSNYVMALVYTLDGSKSIGISFYENTSSSGSNTNSQFPRYSYSYNSSTKVLTITANQGDALFVSEYYYSTTVATPRIEMTGDTYIDNLYIGGHTSNVGDYWGPSYYDLTQGSMAAGTVYNLGSVILNTGIWLLRAQVSFSASSSSYRRVSFSDSSTSCSTGDMELHSGIQTSASPSGPTVLQVTYIANIASNNTTLYLNVISGAAISGADAKIEQVCLA